MPSFCADARSSTEWTRPSLPSIFAKAGAIIANMIESYLAAGAPPLEAKGAAR